MIPFRQNIMKIIYSLLLFLLPSLNSFSSTRSVDIEKTIQNAESIENILVLGYTDSTMLYYSQSNQDTLSVNCPRRKMSKTTRISLINAGKRDASLLAGYWPNIGEEILLIINSDNTLELCARQIGGNYRFWDPQSTPYIETFFSVHENSNFKILDSCKGAEVNYRGYFICRDGCLINKTYFDTHFNSI